MKVLVAEDDNLTRKALIEILNNEGFNTIEAQNGKEALEKFDAKKIDFVCLDIMMPDKNGYQVCEEIRKISSATPIIFLSAKSEEIDKILGFKIGADDYITKPFSLNEVIARINAIARRCLLQKTNQAKEFKLKKMLVSPTNLTISCKKEQNPISLKELKILQFFHNNSNKVISRQELFEECWNMSYLKNTRTLDQSISHLRKKIEFICDCKIIKTVHGVGYIYENK